MKTKVLITISAIAALAFCSCQKAEPVYIEECNCQKNVVLINVEQKDWIYSDLNNNNYFYTNVDMPEITAEAFKYGMIKMYRAYDFNSDGAVQIEMPYTRYLERYWTAEDAWEFYSETLDYEFYVGGVTIYYTMSNFDYEVDLDLIPQKMQFRCVIMQ